MIKGTKVITIAPASFLDEVYIYEGTEGIVDRHDYPYVIVKIEGKDRRFVPIYLKVKNESE